MTISRAMADDEPISVEALNLTAPSEADVALAMRSLASQRGAPNNTICGVHGQLWALTNAIEEDVDRDEARRLLATAYVMGKKMYYKLRGYQRAANR